MTFRKITITFLLCCFNLLGFGQVELFNIGVYSWKYGINKGKWDQDKKIQIVPPLFEHLSEFNRNGLSVSKRTIPLALISLNNKDTIYLSNYYPDKYLSNYHIIPHENYANQITLTLGRDTQSFYERWVTPEEILVNFTINNYMDSTGNYFFNVFPKIDTFRRYNLICIDLYGVIDTNGKIVQPLIYKNIFLDEVRGRQNIFPIIHNNKLGFMDSAGKIIIGNQYDDAVDEYGNFRGKVIGESDFFDMYWFYDNRCKVSINHKLGVIDSNGNAILPFAYQFISTFYKVYEPYPKEIEKFYSIDFNGIQKFFDRNGKEIKE